MWKSSEEEEKVKKMENVPYSNIVGSIMHTMLYDMLDLTHNSSMASKFIATPKKRALACY